MFVLTIRQRSETKPLEHRSALSPDVVQKLTENGFKVNVERSPVRIFDDSDYDGYATLVPEGSWPEAPADHLIVGLKELPEESCNSPVFMD